MEDILAAILFAWIFASLAAGTPPAGFDKAGHYVGTQTTATAHARLK